mmetsp:Transcript_60010/g.125532  ORF Transcript_60010/g.125532 Transcript_60010/m.125532 type:complete len:163 (-) Transcript_60010:118-606(-)
MIERCGTLILSSNTHVLYIAGFQAGGGVGMELRYSGPDTGGSKAFVLPGVIQSPVSLHENKREPLLSSISSEPLLQVGRSALLNSISALERQLQDQSKEVKNLKNRLDGDEHKGDASVTDGKEEVWIGLNGLNRGKNRRSHKSSKDSSTFARPGSFWTNIMA